ncbi:MAG: OmpA family protein [Candidatus Fermentibacteraceae bacterium]
MRKTTLFAVVAVLAVTSLSFAMPSMYGFRGVHRVISGKPLGGNEISFGLMSKYWASTVEVDDMRFFTTTGHTGFVDTLLDVNDKEHYALGSFVLSYGVTEWLELATTLNYRASYYERDLVQPRGFSAGRWDGIDGLADTHLGWKVGFSPTPENHLIWLGLDQWFAFAPRSNDLVSAEDDCGRWFDNEPMYQMRNPTLSTGHTSYGVDGLITFDMGGIWPGTPLKFHSNVGYAYYKQTFGMTDFTYEYDDSAQTVNFADSTGVSLLVKDNVLNLGFALEFPTPYATVFTEYTVNHYLDREGGNDVAYFSPGIRFHTRSGFMMDVVFDLGLTDFDQDYYDLGHALYQNNQNLSDEERAKHAPLPTGGTNDWGIGFNLAFSSDLIVEEVGPTTGTISGMVSDINTGENLEAVLTFPGIAVDSVVSDPATGFYEVEVPPGSVPINVAAEGYQSASATVVLDAGQNVVKDFEMRPEAGMGRITGTVIDSESGDAVVANISIDDMEEPIAVETDEDGVFRLEVPEGTWTIKCEAEDYITRSKPIVVEADGSTVVDFELRPALREGQVLSFSNIYFEVGSSTIQSQSYDVLDQIVEMLKENEDARVQIAGHTDSDGSASYNQQLSEQRAASVFQYLVNHGISASRLETIGFGESQPAVPNTSAANKAQNRRIEFTVLEVRR